MSNGKICVNTYISFSSLFWPITLFSISLYLQLPSYLILDTLLYILDLELYLSHKSHASCQNLVMTYIHHTRPVKGLMSTSLPTQTYLKPLSLIINSIYEWVNRTWRLFIKELVYQTLCTQTETQKCYTTPQYIHKL